MSDINLETAEKFKLYLKDEAKTKSDNKLSQNSLYSYYNKFKACLRLAYKERMLRENWAEYMKGFAQGECFREHLTFKEVLNNIKSMDVNSVMFKLFFSVPKFKPKFIL